MYLFNTQRIQYFNMKWQSGYKKGHHDETITYPVGILTQKHLSNF